MQPGPTSGSASGPGPAGGGAIDIHGHLFAPAVLDQVRRGQVQGVELDRGHLVFAGQRMRRPLDERLTDLTARRAWMRAEGVAIQVVAPEPDSYGYQLPPEEAAAWARRVNEGNAEAVGGARPHDLVGLATLPLPDGRRAAEELRHAVRHLGFVGAMVHSGLTGGYDDPHLEPLWREACELGVPVYLHPALPAEDPRLAKYNLATSVGRLQETAVAACHLICGGVLDRFPELRLILAHGGGSLPYQAHRVDAVWQREGAGWPNAAAPSSYLARLHYDSLLYGAAPLRFLIERTGPERVYLGSDWPFILGGSPLGPVRALADAAARRRVLGENALEMFPSLRG